ncbi:MAG: DNA-protecting protein DprA [Sulfurovaceae bacterium]|nr:DNA-protecting protein DprA [Sulfurovaceae bacterium]
MIGRISENIVEFNVMKKYPKEIFYKGNVELLKKPKISIVGSRNPNQYAQMMTHEIAYKLSCAGICIVSGGAVGIDTISHKAAGLYNTIMVAGTGLDKRYPSINRHLIQDIENYGLVLSQFQLGTQFNKYNFPIRNELVVALGNILIVTYADIDSGTMRSVEYAIKMKKDIYVLPHRIGESEGTNGLLKHGLAKAIYDIDEFIASIGVNNLCIDPGDEFLKYCKTNPTFDDAVVKYGEKVFEYELDGKIKVNNGQIYRI